MSAHRKYPYLTSVARRFMAQPRTDQSVVAFVEFVAQVLTGGAS